MGAQLSDRVAALSTGAKVIGACLVVVLIAIFLPWWTASAGGNSASENGFHGVGWLFILLWLIATALFLIRTLQPSQFESLELPLMDWALYITGGAIMIVLLLLFVVSAPSYAFPGVSYTVSFGWWLALLASVGIVVGGWLTRPAEASAWTSGTSPWTDGSTTGSTGAAPAVPTAEPTPAPAMSTPESNPVPATSDPEPTPAQESSVDEPAEPLTESSADSA